MCKKTALCNIDQRLQQWVCQQKLKCKYTWQFLTDDSSLPTSAGVGRSGAFIAIDRSVQKINDRGDTIDVFGVVFEMRMYRRYMVQTEVTALSHELWSLCCVHEFNRTAKGTAH